MDRGLKYWVKPDIENRIRASEIRAMFKTQVIAIEPTQIRVKNGRSEEIIPATQVFALTGYHPDFSSWKGRASTSTAPPKSPR